MEKINIISLPLVKLLSIVFPAIILGLFIEKIWLIQLILLFGVLGFSFLLLKKLEISYIFFSFAIGLILTFNFLQIQTLPKNSKFVTINAKVYGKVTDVLTAKESFVKVRIEGEIYNEKLQNAASTIALDIHNNNNKLPRIETGDIILCIASVRPPRISNLPTDPAEVQFALSREVLLFGKTTDEKILRIWKNPSSFQSIISNIQAKCNKICVEIFSPQTFPLFSALLLGNRTFLASEQRDKFAITGLSHILALSGFHFGILATIVFFLFSFIKNNWIKFILVCLALVFYLSIVGFPPSGIRATIMILAILYSQTLERKTSIFNTLALILLIIAIFSPASIFNIGFQLSFLAVLGIFLFYKKFFFSLRELLQIRSKISIFFIQIFAVTLSAQIFTAPLVAYYFGYYTFVSFFSNLILLPLFSIAITFGFIGLLVSPLSIEIGKIFGATADLFLSIAIKINDYLANNFSNLVVNDNGVVSLTVFVSFATFWVLKSNQKKIFLLKFALTSLFAILFLLNLKEKSFEQIQIYPREKYVAIIIPSENKAICLLLDRKSHLFPSNDKPMEKFLTTLDKEILIGVTGNVGIAISDNVKKYKRTKILEIPKDVQQKISNLLVGNYEIYKL